MGVQAGDLVGDGWSPDCSRVGNAFAAHVHFKVVVPFEGDAEVSGDAGAAVFGGEDEGGIVVPVLFDGQIGLGLAFEL